ncbi:bifunctional riboflavin kinase/FAD synthetase [Phocaeicola sartorii]|uniref:bifunctional riboflavin kinase/FAD synthetase n=1 Tax=Phocaeicola sartorii TaxID=671267 RepID=UPI001F57145F|nr:bifunctional riboflavin kinase/FAD synthetase [Phocaeicola sartorii]
MEIRSDINHQTLSPSAATIGFFDGVHLGHRFLINQVKEVAAKDGLCSALITFPVHPRQVIQTTYRPQLLSSPTEKIDLLGTTQVDYCILLPFTQELSLLSAREFMRLLRDKFNIHTLVIGYDHRFGHNRSESFDDYCRYGEELNIYIVRARAYTDGEDKISSSVIRQLLKEGKVSQAEKFLGYNYYLDGTVVDGYKVGRKIGFPTANLQVNCSDKLIPSEGVYAVYVYVEGKKWAGMLNIGHRPTINNGKNLSIEVNILNFSEDIYHKEMRIEFVKYLRPEEKYDTIDALIAQMHKDREETARILL